MIGRWAYHWRMGRIVERLFRLAMFDRIVGADNMRVARSELALSAGDGWLFDEMIIMRRRTA